MFNNYSGDYSKTRTKRNPVANLKEISKDYGIPYATLRRKIAKLDPSLPVIMTRKRIKYYDLAELKSLAKEMKE